MVTFTCTKCTTLHCGIASREWSTCHGHHYTIFVSLFESDGHSTRFTHLDPQIKLWTVSIQHYAIGLVCVAGLCFLYLFFPALQSET